MNKWAGAFLLVVCCLAVYCIANWLIRTGFIVDGYHCSGSYNKKKEEYRSTWSLLQRMALFPLFSSKSSKKYVILGILNYCHFLITVSAIIGFLLYECRGIGSSNWVYALCVALGMFVIQRIGLSL